MRSLDHDFQDLVAVRARNETAADQLRQAARVLATSKGSVTSITCVRRLHAGQALEISGLARCLASAYDLTVEIEVGDPIAIRFSRAHSLTSR